MCRYNPERIPGEVNEIRKKKKDKTILKKNVELKYERRNFFLSVLTRERRSLEFQEEKIIDEIPKEPLKKLLMEYFN